MIKSLKIQNFQSHEKTELEFSPGVNIIVGSTDSGKTAIIRALRWLIWNRPSGDSIRSHWGGETSVTLGTENGTISRSKDKIDTYVLVTAKGEEFTFKAFGTSVPEEIQMFLNIGEINLQRQSDAPYLLSKSPGEVASHFNKVARLDKIDLATQNINSWIRSLIQDIKQNEEQKKQATKELTNFDYLEKAEMELEVLEDDNKHLTKLYNAKNRLVKLLIVIKELEEDIVKESNIFKYESLVLELIAYIDKSMKLGLQESKLKNLVRSIKLLDEDLKQTYLLTILEEDVNIILVDIQNRKELEDANENLQKSLNTINKIIKELGTAEADYKAFSTEFKVTFPNVCPLCGKVQ